MNYKNVFLSAMINVILTVQLCHNSVVRSNLDNWSGTGSSVSSPNETHSEVKYNESMTMTTTTEIPIRDIKIVDQKYSQNTSGEYKHEVLFSNGAWRAEQGEYEDHNGVIVFVIRGVFSYFTKEGKYNTTLYIVDEFGYHNVQPPPQLTQDGGGIVDYRPDVQTTSECDNEKGTYCIDPKLLALLVG